MTWLTALFGIPSRLANIEWMLFEIRRLIVQTSTDLTAAVAELQTEVTAIGTQMDTLLADLTAAQGANDPVAVDAAVTAIRAQVDALKAAGARDLPPANP